MRNLNEFNRAQRVQNWLNLVATALDECELTRSSITYDSIFVGSDFSVEGFTALILFARKLLEAGMTNSLPVRTVSDSRWSHIGFGPLGRRFVRPVLDWSESERSRSSSRGPGLRVESVAGRPRNRLMTVPGRGDICVGTGSESTAALVRAERGDLSEVILNDRCNYQRYCMPFLRWLRSSIED